MRAKKPIIVFGDPNEEVKELITKAGLGKYYSFNDAAEDFFDFADNISYNERNIICHNRKNISIELENILNNVC